MVVSVNFYIFFTEVAPKAKIGAFSPAQVDSDRVPGLSDDLRSFFSIELCGFTLFKDTDIAYPAGKFFGIEFYAA